MEYTKKHYDKCFKCSMHLLFTSILTQKLLFFADSQQHYFNLLLNVCANGGT